MSDMLFFTQITFFLPLLLSHLFFHNYLILCGGYLDIQIPSYYMANASNCLHAAF